MPPPRFSLGPIWPTPWNISGGATVLKIGSHHDCILPYMCCTTLIRAMLDAVHAFYIYTNETDFFLISLIEFSKYVQMCNFEVGTSNMLAAIWNKKVPRKNGQSTVCFLSRAHLTLGWEAQCVRQWFIPFFFISELWTQLSSETVQRTARRKKIETFFSFKVNSVPFWSQAVKVHWNNM